MLDERDILLHHSYDAYDPVIAFFAQAADDSDVLAIATLYGVLFGALAHWPGSLRPGILTHMCPTSPPAFSEFKKPVVHEGMKRAMVWRIHLPAVILAAIGAAVGALWLGPRWFWILVLVPPQLSIIPNTLRAGTPRLRLGYLVLNEVLIVAAGLLVLALLVLSVHMP